MNPTLERARPEQVAECFAIIEAAKRFQREQGFVQWTQDYPSEETIREDMRAQRGYVLRCGGEVAGYLCIDFSGEPAYAQIEGAWHTNEPYAVVHRMALGEGHRGKGLGGAALALAEDECRARGVFVLRADTDAQNLRMQRTLERAGFVRCGVVFFQGSPKLAYDKLL